ncbi:MAG: 16S rRNA (cytosine(967)-C(5))-methyltransferase RsmB [Magnetococcales bacterium]|nr:16S rRNA (cytosine(967)-C(5))-methyltransferase RsmB [Magnetococcales bacterium]
MRDLGKTSPDLIVVNTNDLMASGPRARAVLAVMHVLKDGLQLRGHDWLEGLALRDRALAQEIAMGSLRHYALLTTLLNGCMPRPLPPKRHFIRAVLLTALYQALFLRVPARAAVFEAVALVKGSKEKAMVPFCNAILRKAVLLNKEAALTDLEDPVARLAMAHSYPEWLVRRWWQHWGEETCRHILEAGNQPAPLTLRLHGDPSTQQNTMQSLLKAGATLCPETPGALTWEAGGPVENLPGFSEGRFAIADQGAQWIPPLLHPEPGDRILDACAAPGGKTAHLAQLGMGRVQLTAVDKSQARLQRLRENLRRLRVSGVRVVAGDVADGQLLADEKFDRALVDAPCSGTGIIRHHPEIKWLRKPDDPLRMHREQLAILTGVAARMDGGGVVLYATCSMEPEENQDVVKAFLASHPQWRLDPVTTTADGLHPSWIHGDGFLQTWPGLSGMDGFFAARLVRIDGSFKGTPGSRIGKDDPIPFPLPECTPN